MVPYVHSGYLSSVPDLAFHESVLVVQFMNLDDILLMKSTVGTANGAQVGTLISKSGGMMSENAGVQSSSYEDGKDLRSI